MIPMNELTEIAQSLSDFPVDFDKAWKWVGYSRKDSALRTLFENFEEGIEFDSTQKRNQKKQRGGDRKTVKYNLTTDCFKSFCMMAGTEKGKEVRKYFLTVEKKFFEVVQSTKLNQAVRRELTDVIQDHGLNEAMHGFAYKAFTDLIYKAVLGVDAKRYRVQYNLSADANVREYLTPIQKQSVAKIEKLASSMLDVGADYDQVKTMLLGMGERYVLRPGKVLLFSAKKELAK
jgi:Phage anti-repressor protein